MMLRKLAFFALDRTMLPRLGLVLAILSLCMPCWGCPDPDCSDAEPCFHLLETHNHLENGTAAIAWQGPSGRQARGALAPKPVTILRTQSLPQLVAPAALIARQIRPTALRSRDLPLRSSCLLI